jgi:radical SAM protein with 4Fe4S-binding SPASM domain
MDQTPAQTLIRRFPDYPLRRADGSLDCRPLYVVWETTLRCDQACRFCGTRAGRPRPDELTTQEMVDVVEQLAALGTREIAIHGGEAYLRPDWLTLIRTAASHGIDTTMVSGGRGITPEVAVQAKEAGLRAISISIDGLQATHDRLRALRGSHAGAMAAVRNLRAAGVSVGCNTQLNAENFRELPALADQFCELGLYGWQVQLMVPMGRAADTESLWLQPYDLLELFPLLAEARRRCDARGLKLWPGDNIGYFGPFEQLLRAGRTAWSHCSGCGGGLVVLGIESNGDLKGCSAMCSEGFVAGNTRERSIAEVWAEAPELRFMRDFKLDDLWGFCRGCYYADQCRAGCIWTGSSLLGRKGNNPYCHHRALEMLRHGKRERLRLVKAAEGHIRDKAVFEVDIEDAPAEWRDAMNRLTMGETRFQAAERLVRAREFAHAEDVLDALVEATPDDIAALDLLGYVLFAQGRAAEAEAVCRHTLDIAPEHPYAWKGLGVCLGERGETDAAVTALERACALAPDWADARHDLFAVLSRAGRAAEAQAVLARAAGSVREERSVS